MFCSKCGAQIPDDAQHCPQCGAEVKPVVPAPQAAPVPQAAPAPAPAPKKKFTGNKLYLLLVIAMFVSAFLEYWVAMAVLLVAIVLFVKDKWTIRNAVQPFAVGTVLCVCDWITDILQGTATVTYIPVFGTPILYNILEYSLEAVRIAGIVFLVIGIITLLKGETRIPIFSAFAKHFPDEEKKEAEA